MNQTVSISLQSQIAVITIDNPPVNALSQAVRQGLVECLNEVVNVSNGLTGVATTHPWIKQTW